MSRNRQLVGSIILVTLLLFSLSPVAASDYRVIRFERKGTIVGTVRYEGPVLNMPTLEVTRDTASCGTAPKRIEAVKMAPDGHLRNVVVYLANITAGKPFPPLSEPPVLAQRHCDFTPHMQLVPKGVGIKITNEDGILHSVHAHLFPRGTAFVLYPNSISSPSRTLFNVAMLAERKELFRKLDSSGVVKVVCDAGHYWMTAYVVVADHPYYSLVDEKGNFILTDVPEGTYQVEAWHEYLGTVTKNVKLETGARLDLQFVFHGEP